jgi:hypothetical protein
MPKELTSYCYRNFMIVYGLCGYHPHQWHVRDFRDYDEDLGSNPTDICTKTIAEAKKKINELITSGAAS